MPLFLEYLFALLAVISIRLTSVVIISLPGTWEYKLRGFSSFNTSYSLFRRSIIATAGIQIAYACYCAGASFWYCNWKIFFNLVPDNPIIDFFSAFGLVYLMFLAGMEMDLAKIHWKIMKKVLMRSPSLSIRQLPASCD